MMIDDDVLYSNFILQVQNNAVEPLLLNNIIYHSQLKGSLCSFGEEI